MIIYHDYFYGTARSIQDDSSSSSTISYSLSCCITVVILGYDWWLCMVINISVQYSGGLLPDIILY